jgi:hypothetical protein
MATLSVAALRANPLVCDLLGGPFEFIVCDGTSDPVWFTVEGCDDLHPVAEDGSGGVYALVGSKRAACSMYRRRDAPAPSRGISAPRLRLSLRARTGTI